MKSFQFFEKKNWLYPVILMIAMFLNIQCKPDDKTCIAKTFDIETYTKELTWFQADVYGAQWFLGDNISINYPPSGYPQFPMEIAISHGITGANGNISYDRIYLYFSSLMPGTYLIDGSQAKAIYEDSDLVPYEGSGELVITDIDQVKKNFDCTFHFDGLSPSYDFISVTDGLLYHVRY